MYSKPLFGPAILVAITIFSLCAVPIFFIQVPICLSVLPTICAFPPIGYISAVSIKFIPLSTAQSN